jgi:hypothetical protein
LEVCCEREKCFQYFCCRDELGPIL